MKFVQLTELENRHKEFLKLEECLIEVNSMFIELSELVAQQGDMVDSIEANVNNAREYVSSLFFKPMFIIQINQGVQHWAMAKAI